VGEIRLWQGGEAVIEGDLQDFRVAEAVGFSRRQFRLVIETFDDAG
jgi:hypothetical protein